MVKLLNKCIGDFLTIINFKGIPKNAKYVLEISLKVLSRYKDIGIPLGCVTRSELVLKHQPSNLIVVK